MQPDDSVHQAFRYYVTCSDYRVLGQELARFGFLEPSEVQIPGVAPPPGRLLGTRKVASRDAKQQAVFRVVVRPEKADAIISGTGGLTWRSQASIQGSSNASGTSVRGQAGDIPNAMLALTVTSAAGDILGAYSASTGPNILSGRGAGSAAAYQVVKKMRKAVGKKRKRGGQ